MTIKNLSSYSNYELKSGIMKELTEEKIRNSNFIWYLERIVRLRHNAYRESDRKKVALPVQEYLHSRSVWTILVAFSIL